MTYRKQPAWLVTALAVGLTLGGAALAVPVADLVGEQATSTAAPVTTHAPPQISDPLTVTTAPETTTTSPQTSGTSGAQTSPTTTRTAPPASTTAPLVDLDVTAAIAVGAAVDQIRLDLGLPALDTDLQLDAYAERQALLMATTGDLTHGPVESLLDGWVAIGENVGTGDNPAEVVAALADSPDHYLLLTEAAYDVDGIGAARDADGNLWVCLVFAADELPIVTTTTTLPPVETTLPPVDTTIPVETTLPDVTLPTLP